jgi:ferrous iron transport protein A
MGNEATVRLTQVPKGRKAVVIDVPAGKSRDQLIRLGIHTGEEIRCLQRLPGGTMLIEKHRQEIAIGVSLADVITVRLDGEQDSHE